MKKVHVWCVLSLAGMLLACGQKGPLVLPDTPTHRKAVRGPRPPAAPVHPAPNTPAPPAMGAPAGPGSPTERAPGTPEPAGPPADTTSTPSDAPQKP